MMERVLFETLSVNSAIVVVRHSARGGRTMMKSTKMSMKIMPMVNINMALHTVSFKLLKDPQFRKEAENMNRLLSYVLNLIFLKLKIMKVIIRMIVRKSPPIQ